MKRQLNTPRLQLCEFALRTFVATLEPETTVSDLIDPEFWSMVVRDLIPGSIITCRWDDNSGHGDLYVQDNSQGRVIVVPIRGGFTRFDEFDARDLEPETVDGIRVEHGGLQERWRVVRERDGYAIKTGLPTRGEARRQRTNYLKTLSGTRAAA